MNYRYFIFIRRVVGYMKNGWEDDFLDKWKQAPTGASSCQHNESTNTTCEFPGSAEWIALLDETDSMPNFNMQHVINYFIERKANDNECNNNYKNISSKAFGLFRHGHVQKIELASDQDNVHFRCECLPEMKKSMTYKLKLSLAKVG